MTEPEVWLRGPITGIPPVLMPVAHALVQTGEDVQRLTSDLSAAELWATPGGAASIGFHVVHLTGSLDRLFTYARGEPLSQTQRRALLAERGPGEPPREAAELVERLRDGVAAALEQLRGVDPERLLDARAVGRAQLPSTVLGLLFHAAEHAQRHAGQIATTRKILKGLATSP